MSRRRRVALIAPLVAAALAMFASAALTAGRNPAAAGPAALAGVEFVVVCRFSHRAHDDPIVLPRQPGMSHGHTFFGNSSTDAFSTPATLAPAPTTCHQADDRAAYWIPTLLRDDRGVEAIEAKIYYRRATLARVHAFPPKLAMIGGDADARRPQSTRVTWWDCGEQGGIPASSSVPTCPDDRSRSLRLHVSFPDCWDGRRLDSPNHRSHMAYSREGSCPGSHSTPVPAMELVAQYPITGAGRIELSSLGQFSGHGDFVNAWRQSRLQQLVDLCLNALRRCS